MLGPPVCNPCMRILDFEYKPQSGHHHWWRCEKCGRDPVTHPKDIGNLFCYNSETRRKLLDDDELADNVDRLLNG